MCKLKRRRCAKVEGEGIDTTQSSYKQLKARYEKQEHELQRSLLSLQMTQHEKKEIETKCQEACKDLQDTQRRNVEIAAELDKLNEENVRLKRCIGVCRREMEGLKASIISGSDAYDNMVAKVAELEQKIEEAKTKKGHDKVISKISEIAVCRNFGWSKNTVDPELFRAAVGFWEGCTPAVNEVQKRTSWKIRKDMLLQLCCVGFKGQVLNELEGAMKKRTRFDVIELARKSDVNCQFNATAVGAVSQCQEGIKKYERGILCSDTTLRRTQKRVLHLAKSLGFSTFPTVEEGKVWCWGDEHGEFVSAVNRYVYEVYVKARSALVTRDKPWLVALSGDLVRVTTRGKSMTICGPKLVDPRLPCQQATGKTSNQSRNLYTPAVAGYVDEAHLMKYFDRMVDCFRVIQEQGYCVVQNERHEVFIDVLVVADMAYLHKFLRRGGGSHSCTHFCFLCSISSKYRQEGYPGGCRKCRVKDIVYDSNTAVKTMIQTTWIGVEQYRLCLHGILKWS